MIDFALTYAPLYFKGALAGLGLTALSMAGTLFRGIPPLVLLYIVYFGLPGLAFPLCASPVQPKNAP